ncbi:MAG: hypothetical protein AAF357_13995, partial [Verrucomicrobiota bacterium]
IVAELNALASAKAEEIKVQTRPVGLVENPVMLYPSDAPIRDSKIKAADIKPLDWEKVKKGDTFPSSAAPAIARQKFAIEVNVSGENMTGPIIAHGGSAVGYVLYAQGEEFVLAVSRGGEIKRVTLPIKETDSPLQATIARTTLSLAQGERSSSIDGHWIDKHPQEDLSIGYDVRRPVDPEQPKGEFTGEIESLSVTTTKL